jgi:hypothetical protein
MELIDRYSAFAPQIKSTWIRHVVRWFTENRKYFPSKLSLGVTRVDGD